MSSSFVVVICHGSYHTPEPYQPFLDALKKAGIEGHCPQLPTSDLTKLNVGDVSNPDFNRDPPPGGYPQPADDAEVIQRLLTQLIAEEGKNVILLGHSSGGFSANASAIPELQAKNRKAKGLSGGIIGIFYACALVIPVGESIHSFFQPKDGSPAVPPHFSKYYVSRGNFHFSLSSWTVEQD
jgi:Alpha/beta hydrolase family